MPRNWVQRSAGACADPVAMRRRRSDGAINGIAAHRGHPWAADSNQLGLGADDQGVARRRRGRHRDFTHPVGREQLERAARLDDEHVAVFAREIEAIAGGDRRRAEAGRFGADPLLIDPLAGLGVVGAQDAVVGADVEDAVVHQRRSGVRRAALGLPGDAPLPTVPDPPGRIA